MGRDRDSAARPREQASLQQIAERLGNAIAIPDSETARCTFPLEFWLGRVAEKRVPHPGPTEFPFGFGDWPDGRRAGFYSGFLSGMQRRPWLYDGRRRPAPFKPRSPHLTFGLGQHFLALRVNIRARRELYACPRPILWFRDERPHKPNSSLKAGPRSGFPGKLAAWPPRYIGPSVVSS